MFFIISFLLGIVASILATMIYPQIACFLSKYSKYIGLDSHYRIIAEKANKLVFNDIICLDISEKVFSQIATKYMRNNNNRNILITNIQEPKWFYKKFKEYVEDIDHGATEIKTILDEYENAFLKSINLNTANEKINVISKEFYSKNSSIKIFPHLKSFSMSKIDNKARINFFDLKLANITSCDNFKKRNKAYEVYFFEKLINFETKSLFKNIGENDYNGTDALILNNKIVLNYYDSIQELNYQNNHLIKIVKGGFFHYIIEEYINNTSNFDDTSTILKRVYGIDI